MGWVTQAIKSLEKPKGKVFLLLKLRVEIAVINLMYFYHRWYIGDFFPKPLGGHYTVASVLQWSAYSMKILHKIIFLH